MISMCVFMLSRFSLVRLFTTLWTVCSPPGSSVHWDSPGKNIGVGCHTLLQGIFLTRDLTHVSYVSYIGRQVLYH